MGWCLLDIYYYVPGSFSYPHPDSALCNLYEVGTQPLSAAEEDSDRKVKDKDIT